MVRFLELIDFFLELIYLINFKSCQQLCSNRHCHTNYRFHRNNRSKIQVRIQRCRNSSIRATPHCKHNFQSRQHWELEQVAATNSFYPAEFLSLRNFSNSVSITLSNAYLSGLSQYTTNNTKVNLFGGSLGFTTVFPQIKLNGTHRTSGKSKRQDHHYHNQDSNSFSGSGAFTITVRGK